MKNIIFRVLGLILGCLILYIHFFNDNPGAQNTWISIRNIVVGFIFIVFAAGGNNLVQKTPILKHLNGSKDET